MLSSSFLSVFSSTFAWAGPPQIGVSAQHPTLPSSNALKKPESFLVFVFPEQGSSHPCQNTTCWLRVTGSPCCPTHTPKWWLMVSAGLVVVAAACESECLSSAFPYIAAGIKISFDASFQWEIIHVPPRVLKLPRKSKQNVILKKISHWGVGNQTLMTSVYLFELISFLSPLILPRLAAMLFIWHPKQAWGFVLATPSVWNVLPPMSTWLTLEVFGSFLIEICSDNLVKTPSPLHTHTRTLTHTHWQTHTHILGPLILLHFSP